MLRYTFNTSKKWYTSKMIKLIEVSNMFKIDMKNKAIPSSNHKQINYKLSTA